MTTLSSRYASGTKGAGGPAGAGTNGDWYYDTTAKRAYRSDGVGWIVMTEPLQSFGSLSVASTAGTITTLGASALAYHRSDGYLEYEASIGITTNGTGAGALNMTIPVVSAETHIGNGREILSSGKTLSVSHLSAGVGSILNYDNSYPGGSGFALMLHGRYRMLSRYS